MATLWYQPFESPKNLNIPSQIQPATVYCVACAYKFPDKSSLEEHVCPAVSYICTCGMGFTNYKKMLKHRNGHNDMTSLQSDHVTIMKEKLQDAQIREMRLRMLERIDQALQQESAPPAPSTSKGKHFSPMAHTLNNKSPRVKVRVPTTMSLSHPYMPTAGPSKSFSLQHMPYRVPSLTPTAINVPKTGALVNFTLRFQPAVVLRTKTLFHAGGPYMCATCRIIFWTKKLLVAHISTHVMAKVHGCMRCGRLLLGNTPPSSQHFCGTYFASIKDRFTSGHFFSHASPVARKQYSMTRCPHCPATFFQPWYLKRHCKKMHPEKLAKDPVKSLPQFPNIDAIIAKTGLASLPQGQAKDPVMPFPQFPNMDAVIAKTGLASVPQGQAKDPVMPKPQFSNIDAIIAKTGLASVPQGQESKMSQESIRKITDMKGWNKNGMLRSELLRPTLKVVQMVEDSKTPGATEEMVINKQPPSHCRCAICGKTLSSIQLLGQHLCKRKLTLLRHEELPRMPLKSTGVHRSALSRPAPYSLASRDSEEMVTLQLQTSHSTEMHQPALKNMNVELAERSCSPLFKSVAVQTKVEFDDGSYDAALNTSTTISSPTKV